MSSCRVVELSSFGSVKMSRCRVVEMSRCRVVEKEKSTILTQNAFRRIAGSGKWWQSQKSQNGGKGLYSISSLKLPFLQGTSGS